MKSMPIQGHTVPVSPVSGSIPGCFPPLSSRAPCPAGGLCFQYLVRLLKDRSLRRQAYRLQAHRCLASRRRECPAPGVPGSEVPAATGVPGSEFRCQRPPQAVLDLSLHVAHADRHHEDHYHANHRHLDYRFAGRPHLREDDPDFQEHPTRPAAG